MLRKVEASGYGEKGEGEEEDRVYTDARVSILCSSDVADLADTPGRGGRSILKMKRSVGVSMYSASVTL